MRLVSLITALVVVTALYLLVFQRDDVIGFANGDAEAEITAEATEAAPESAKQAVAVSVVALRSEAAVVDSAVIIRGNTEAAREVNVRAETSGLVISAPRRKGAQVSAGEMLCRLDPGTREIALAEANSRLEEARAGLADAEINESAAARLSEDGFASETRVTAMRAAVQSARAAVQSAEAGIAGAAKEIDRLELRAPFEGLLESDTAETGSLLQPGALCATIIDLDPIKLVGFVPETEVDRVGQGAPASARLASGREVTGQVTFISRSADDTTRTFRIEVEVENADLRIRDGQTVEIAIASDGARAHLLPQSALTLSNEGRLGVRIVDADNLAAFAEVSIIRDTVDGVWVSGLEENVEVIVVGQEYVTDGVPVRPTYKEAQLQ
jgi:multidrug efflux system membrane fusion protein